MTFYNLLMGLGLVGMIGIMETGFWRVTRVKPARQSPKRRCPADVRDMRTATAKTLARLRRT